MHSIILSRRNFRESDQIISLYTLEKGKLEVLARGVKKITSKNSAHLEPFSFVDAEIIPGKELDHLGAVQPIDYFVDVRKDLDKSLAAGYVVSLLDKLIEAGEKDERIFDLLRTFLDFLNRQLPITNYQLLISAFVVKLLFLLGLDITQADKLSPELEKNLKLLNNGDWKKISNFKFQISNYRRLHNFIYKFLVYQTEKNLKDWLNLAKI